MVYYGADEITYFLDANLNILGTVPVGGLMSGMVYSPDGRYLYVVSDTYSGVDPTQTRPVVSNIDKPHSTCRDAPAYWRNPRCGPQWSLLIN